MSRISRRRMLQLGSLGTLGAAMPGTVLQAFARPVDAPRRLVIISHCHGWPYTTWRLRPHGLPDTEPWAVNLASLRREELSRPLAPLYEHRHRLLALDGLSLATAELDAGGNRHDRGWIHAWTGNNADFAARDTRSTSASLDQLVAARIARPDRLPSLELSVDAALEAGGAPKLSKLHLGENRIGCGGIGDVPCGIARLAEAGGCPCCRQ